MESIEGSEHEGYHFLLFRSNQNQETAQSKLGLIKYIYRETYLGSFIKVQHRVMLNRTEQKMKVQVLSTT